MEGIILSLLIFVPLVGAVVVLALPQWMAHFYRWITVGACAVQLVLTLVLLGQFDSKDTSFQAVEKLDWITLQISQLGTLSIDYHLGVDGMSILMVLLAGIIMTVGAISSWNITEKRKGYFSLYLVLSSNIVGCFVALDFFLFYLFFEFMLLPMYFLIGLWGGERRAYASIKFFLYTLVGSLFILVVMISLSLSVIDPSETGKMMGVNDEYQVQEMLANGRIDQTRLVRTFSIPSMLDHRNIIPDSVLDLVAGSSFDSEHFRYWAFLLMFIGFAIKLPIVPLHTWLPDAHVEAPTPISVVLAGILLKIGGYGFFRFAYGMFPDGAVHFGFWIAALGVLAILYGGFNAMAQKDLKKLIAYSSVSHMGFVLLGLASMTDEGAMGGMMMMFSHGLTSGASFLIAGVIYDRTHDRMIDNYSGLASRLPYFTFISVVVFFASLGLPGFSGFVAEIFAFLGSFASGPQNGIIPTWLAATALFGLLISAAYYLWVIQRMYFGEFWVRPASGEDMMYDLSKREWIMLAPLVILMLLFGVLPSLIMDLASPSLSVFVDEVWSQGNSMLHILNSQ